MTVAALLAFGATAAGCSSGRHASATTSPSVNDQALALSIGLQFAQCARQHGRPDFPDPAIQDGALAFPGASKEDQLAVQDACVSILRRLPASMRQQNRPPTADELAKLRQFAQCMRQHGVPDWPDPKSDGTFPIIGTPLEAEGKSQRIIDGEQACAQYFSGGINAS